MQIVLYDVIDPNQTAYVRGISVENNQSSILFMENTPRRRIWMLS
jgi:hypothetical protein